MRARLMLLGLAWAGLRAQAPGWGQLQGARIAEVRIEIRNVFDTSQPAEDTWLGRLANKIHAPTHASVVRETLLFREGDRVDAERIRESERLLRAYRFVKDAEIDPEPLPDGSVRALVRVRDAWTLKLSAGYQHVGGQNSLDFGLREQNLLGSGKTLEFRQDTDPARRTDTFGYFDPQVFGGRWTFAATYQALSDGFARGFDLERPFFALDTPWSATFSASTRKSRLLVYNATLQAYAAPSRLDAVDLGAAWRLGGSEAEAWRGGFLLESRDARYGAVALTANPDLLGPPALADRRLRGPALSLSYLRDGFRSFKDLQGTDTPEDYNLGWSGSGVLGSYLRSWGSTESAPFGRVQLAKGWSASPDTLLLAQGSASGRRGPEGFEDALLDASASAYLKLTPHQVLATYLALDSARRPDPEDLLYLGGVEGLRGYSNNLQPGDRRWLFSFEHRALTEQRWWGLLRVGFVSFVDAGAIRRLDGTGWSRVYTDLGWGLRFGDLKSSLGRVVLLTFAVPLVRGPGQDKWQVVVGNTVRF